jgi:REP element-mobilizing transposase RayT
MARLARFVVPGHPLRATQRGNRRQPIFFESSDYALYRDLLAEQCRKAAVEAWAYCLMPNHIHLVLMPHTEGALARALGETHRHYTGFVNARARWTGHLFRAGSARWRWTMRTLFSRGPHRQCVIRHAARRGKRAAARSAPMTSSCRSSRLGRSLQRHTPGRKPREQASGQLKLDIGNE